MSTKRDLILGTSSRKTRRVHFPELGPDGMDVGVRELSADARMAFMSAMAVDTKGESASMDMNVLLPYVTELMEDPDSGDLLFELADHDVLVDKHPGIVGKVLFTSVDLSEIGKEADAAAEGNSEPTPN